MKIILTSDLHIDPSEDRSFLIDKFCECLRQIYVSTDEIVIFVFGDITDHGKKEFFENAIKNFNYILEQMKGWSITFEFIPGNHDICDKNLKDFDDFIEKFQAEKHRFSEKSTYSKVYENINFIFASSSDDFEHSYGNVNLDSIKSNIKRDIQNVLLVHHSLISEYKKETTMTDIPSIHKFLTDNKIEFVLHGHTHASRNIHIISGIHLIGTGSLLAGMSGNENNQFNVLGIKNGRIISIANYRYIADNGSFTNCYDIYPEGKQYTDPAKIKRYKYDEVKTYIERKVWPYSVAAADVVTRFFYHPEDKRTLIEVCKSEKENLIVLLSDAGTGKSYELDQLAHYLSNDGSPFYPIRINLNKSGCTELTDLLKGEFDVYKNLRPESLFWILDGFDEIDPNRVTEFRRNLEKYRFDNPETHILLSSRTNFLKAKTPDGSWGTFANSAEYTLCPLENSDVIGYLSSRGIDSEKFIIEMKDKRLADLQYIPFYLIQLADIYKSIRSLPNKTELMDTLILKSFRSDIHKFDYTIDLETNKEELFNILEHAAFALQLLNRNYMTDDEYQRLFSTEVRRNLLKFSALWVQSEGMWAFSHNNFREYLAAKMLSKLAVKQILSYVTYAANKNETKPEWLNTISFLLSIYKSDDLRVWLSCNTPYTLIKFESDRVSPEMRLSILKSMFSECKKKNLWFETERCSERELAIFTESPEAIDYLLLELTAADPDHFRAQYTSLRILAFFDNYFDRTEKIRTTLLLYIVKPKTRYHEINVAISVLGHERIECPEITDLIMTKFSDINDDTIRSGIYRYLVATNNQDTYVSYFLNGIQCAKQRHVTNISELMALTEGIKKLDGAAALSEAILFLVKTRRRRHTLHDEAEIFDLLCAKAEALYNKGNSSIYDMLRTAFCMAADEVETQYADRILQFFDKTHTRKFVLNYVLTQKLNHDYFVIFMVIGNDLECLEEFARLYEHDELPNSSLFYQFTMRMPQNTLYFQQFSELLGVKEGKVIPKIEITDYEHLRKDGRQSFFNSLFDESSLKQLLDGLLSLYGREINYEELFDAGPSEKRHDIQMLAWAIHRYAHTAHRTSDRVVDFFDFVPWRNFSIHELYELLSDDVNTLIINEPQQHYIKQLYDEIIKRVDFNTVISYEDDYNYSYTRDSMYAVCFLRYFDFLCPENVLLDMLMMPPDFCIGKKHSEKDLNYISARISPEKLKSRIIYNIQNRKLIGDVFVSHVEYCTEHGLPNAIPIALDVCKDTKRSFMVKHAAYEYLLKIQGAEYLYEHVIPCTDDELFMDIVRNLYQDKSIKLEKAIIERYKTTGSRELLIYLIKMNSRFGLNQYIKIVRLLNKTPEKEGEYSGGTEAIASIRRITLLPKLIKLSKLMFRKNFSDHSFKSLHNCLVTALSAIGTNNGYKKVKFAIMTLRIFKRRDSNCTYFCNSILDNIKSQYLKDTDKKYELNDIKRILQCLTP